MHYLGCAARAKEVTELGVSSSPNPANGVLPKSASGEEKWLGLIFSCKHSRTR
jgi:hypothetical protein